MNLSGQGLRDMTMLTVHLPRITPSLIRPSSRSRPIRSCQINRIFHLTSIKIHSDSSFKLRCIRKDSNHKASQDFSVLKTDLQSDNGSTWTTMAFYVFSLHIPLSFGGLSAVAQLLHQTPLDPDTQALSLLLLQTSELVSFMLLLQFSEKPFNILSFFESRVLPKERSWLIASVLGLGFLLAFVFLTSLVADKLIGSKDVNNPILKEILSSGSLSVFWSSLVYCIVTPVLEETVYRGFLLTSLASKMEWQKAVLISSIVFSATHLSIDNFLQLCVIGAVLGCSYCWSAFHCFCKRFIFPLVAASASLLCSKSIL